MNRGFFKSFALTLFILLLSCNPFDPVDPITADQSTESKNDSYEPNNSINQASFLKSDSTNNLICTPGDFDYFKFVVDSSTLNTLKIQTVPNSNSINMSSISFYLYSKTGTSLKGSSLLSDSVRAVSFFSSIRDTFYCYVYNSSSYTKELKYSLTNKSGKISVIDTTEPNNSIKTATLAANTNRTAFIQNVNDTDWYKIPLLANEYLTVSVASDSINLTQVAPILTKSSGANISGTKVGYTTTYTYFSSISDTCYLKVYIYPPKVSSSPSRYFISINKVTAVDDSFEENDTKLTAKLITKGKTDSLKVIGTDIDYYKFAFDTTMYIEAVIKVLTPSSILSVALESVNTTFKNTYNSSSVDSIKISHVVSAKDSLYLKVSNYSSSSTSLAIVPYSIELRATPIIDDRFEENDTKLTAKPISVGKTDSLMSVGSDIDYYKLSFDSTMYVEAVLKTPSIMTSSSYLYLTLESLTSTLTTAYNNSSDSVKITFTAAAKDSLYLKIYNPASSSSSPQLIPYSIEIRSVPISKYDPYEPNNTKLTATLMDSSSLSSFIVAKNDTDYFKIPIAQNETINLNFNKGTSSTYYSLLTNSAGNTITGSTSGMTTTFIYSSQKNDTLYLKIYTASATTITSPLSYSLQVSRSKFTDDIYEENDTKLTATMITPGKYDSLKAYIGDNDYYKVSFDIPVMVDAIVRRSGTLSSSSTMNVYLETISSTLASSTTISSDSLHLTYPFAAGDTMYVRVQYSSSSSTAPVYVPYSLQIKTTPLSEIDPLEPNNTQLTAITIDSSTSSLIYSSTDADWFKIPHAKDELLNVQVKTDSLKGQRVSSSLYNYSSSSISGYALSNFTTSYTYSSTQNDTCYLKVNWYNGTSSTPYQIIITRTKIAEDSYEENDTKLTAKEIEIGKIHDSLIVIGTDVDYYKFSVDTISAINFVLRPQVKMTSSSYLSFSLESISSTLKSTSSYSSDSLQIIYTVNPNDTFYLKVAASSAQSIIPYTLNLKATPIADDEYEDNDTLSTAVKIPFGLYDLKYVDQDWFSIDVDSGVTIRLDAELSSATSSTIYMYLYSKPSTSLSTINYVALSFNSTTGFSYASTKKQTLYIAFRSTNFTGTSELNYRFRVVQL